MVAVYVIAWSPYATVAFIGTLKGFGGMPVGLTIFAPFFAKAECFLNPIIYAVTNKKFKDAFLHILSICFGKGILEQKPKVSKKKVVPANIAVVEEDGNATMALSADMTITTRNVAANPAAAQ